MLALGLISGLLVWLATKIIYSMIFIHARDFDGWIYVLFPWLFLWSGMYIGVSLRTSNPSRLSLVTVPSLCAGLTYLGCVIGYALAGRTYFVEAIGGKLSPSMYLFGVFVNPMHILFVLAAAIGSLVSIVLSIVLYRKESLDRPD